MNVTLIYFSQTGNTRIVADTMADAFRQDGHATKLISLKKATHQDTISCDLLGIGTPCFSSQAPTPVKDFLHTLPTLNKKPAFVFATSGGAPGRVLYDLTHSLRSKKAVVVGGFLSRGEIHHPAPCLVGRFPKRPNKDDLDHARHFAKSISDHVSAGRLGPVAGSRPDTSRPTGKFYNAVALLSTDKFLRRVLPKPKLDPARCDNCEWCIFECPTHNITAEPYPILGEKCIRCYRCLTGCPQQAFNANWSLGNLSVWLFYNVTIERWFGDLQPGERFY